MIVSITANRGSFKPFRPTEAFNVVLAERTERSQEKDSRNGSGKTSLLRILHWCLGASADKNHPFRKADALSEWRFSLNLRLGENTLIASRSVETPGRIELWSETLAELVPEARPGDDESWVPLDEWKGQILGRVFFGVTPDELASEGHPRPRDLIHYFARLDRDAFIDPFKHFARQGAAESQSQQAFLLGLDWHYPIRNRELSAEAKKLQDAQKEIALSAALGHGHDDVETLEAELQAAIVNLEGEVVTRTRELDRFQVLPQYKDIESEAGRLTVALHELTTENLTDQQRISFYERSLDDEKPADLVRLRQMYAEAGVVFGDRLTRRLEEVEAFHARLIENRREYLGGELGRLRSLIASRETDLDKANQRRAELMRVLKEHGALDEFQRLQELHGQRTAQLERLRTELDQLHRFESRLGEVQLERQQLVLDTRRDLAERRETLSDAVRIFGANTAALYTEPGALLIGANRDGGYSLKYDIAKGDSQGVQEMVVFAYDLMLAELWASKGRGPGFLVHDSTLFDGVDERQVARALALADQKSRECGFQYICLLNSDGLPINELPSDFDLDERTVLRLSDTGEDGGLFGQRFG
jgi:uncharacterized protein YydD (DUF2326 family)